MGFLGGRRIRRAAGRVDEVPADDPDEEGPARGGHLIRAVPGARPTTLAEPLRTVRAEAVKVAPPARDLEPGVDHLLGGPGELTCEVVRIALEEAPPGEPRRLLRGRYRTLPSPHPAGTTVTAVTAERVEDWSRWSAGESEPAAEGDPGGAGTKSPRRESPSG